MAGVYIGDSVCLEQIMKILFPAHKQNEFLLLSMQSNLSKIQLTKRSLLGMVQLLAEGLLMSDPFQILQATILWSGLTKERFSDSILHLQLQSQFQQMRMSDILSV